MVCCCAVGCSNSSHEAFACFLFRKKKRGRKVWLIKIKRDKWTPTVGSRLCEARIKAHFEESQLEQSRSDGWKKLKQTEAMKSKKN
ncbi:unnamed protein product [Ixodes pacificus]